MLTFERVSYQKYLTFNLRIFIQIIEAFALSLAIETSQISKCHETISKSSRFGVGSLIRDMGLARASIAISGDLRLFICFTYKDSYYGKTIFSGSSMPGSKEVHSEAPVIPMGKEATFDYFFRQYYAALCFFAQSIIHHQEDAKDIVQDCFVKLWDDTTITEKAESVKSFLYTMVRNRCIDYTRKQKVRTKAAIYLQPIETDEEYFDELAFAEMLRLVLQHIEELPANMSTVLKKYYLQGRKHKEIAKELSTTPDAVRMQKTRALKLLKQKFSLLFLITLFVLAG